MSFNVLCLLLLDVGLNDEPSDDDPCHDGRDGPVKDRAGHHFFAQVDGEVVDLVAPRQSADGQCYY